MKRFVLILLALATLVLLNGCCMNCCPTCPQIQTCTLTVEAGYYVWGEVYINGQPTGKNIDYSIPSLKKAIVSAPCNQTVSVWITDPCGYQSHTETIYIDYGNNSLYFAYW
jgi:hypothetical protein